MPSLLLIVGRGADLFRSLRWSRIIGAVGVLAVVDCRESGGLQLVERFEVERRRFGGEHGATGDGTRCSKKRPRSRKRKRRPRKRRPTRRRKTQRLPLSLKRRRSRRRKVGDRPALEGGGYLRRHCRARRHVMNVVDNLAWIQGVRNFKATHGYKAKDYGGIHERLCQSIRPSVATRLKQMKSISTTLTAKPTATSGSSTL